MRSRLRLAVVITSLMGIGIFLFLFGQTEPVYQGRQLSDWLNGYDSGASREARRQTDEAVLHIGTNGLPWLLKWIRYEESTVMSQARRVLRKLPLKGGATEWFLIDQKLARAEQAARAIAALGPAAEPAIQDLATIMNEPDAASANARAAFALANAGLNALPALIAVLTNQQAAARSFAAHWIYYLGTNAHPAVPLLIECLRDPEPLIARGAIYSLGELKLEPDIVVPALASCLDSSMPDRQPDAATALAKFGPEAATAVPALLSALTDSWFTVRNAATNALLKIAPQALTNAFAR